MTVTGKVRVFESGATRDTDEGKLDYEGFMSPLAIERFAQYMNKHRKQSDGSLRDSDNWQKGVPVESYVKSMWRHFFDVWAILRGWGVWVAVEGDLEEALCALKFNVDGLLHEVVKQRLLEETEQCS